MEKPDYNEKLDLDRQLNYEEWIARQIFHADGWEGNEEEANDLGKRIFYKILRNFRRDMFDDYQK